MMVIMHSTLATWVDNTIDSLKLTTFVDVTAPQDRVMRHTTVANSSLRIKLVRGKYLISKPGCVFTDECQMLLGRGAGSPRPL